MGQTATQTKYLTKIVQFNGQKMTLFSLDGNTWSTRKLELAEIKQRHELQRAELAGKAEEADAATGPGADTEKPEEDSIEDDGRPFSISEEDDVDDVEASREKGRTRLRAKAAKPVAKLPAKPSFNKNRGKPDIKISPKKKETAKVVAVKEKSKVKKTSKLTIAKPSKKSKSAAPKKRKAA